MNNINMLTVYLGSSGHARAVFKKAAEELGRLIGGSGKGLVYGGMDAGLMGILAASALKEGGAVTGIIPTTLQDSERALPGLTDTIFVKELCDRKKQMFLTADAILALPGGYGTLDESLEVLYWANYRGQALHSKPLVMINIEGYWDPMIDYLRTLPDFNADYLLVAESAEGALAALAAFEPLPPVETPLHLPHFEDEIMRDTSEPILIDKASVENTYMVICALGLKQLAKHQRAIGLLNENRQFDGLVEWINRAAKENFITQDCLKLFDIHADRAELLKLLARQEPVKINLHTLKWGPPEKITLEHEIKEATE